MTTWRDIDGCAVAFDDNGRVRLVVSDGVANLFDKADAHGVDADAIVNLMIGQAEHVDPASLAYESPPSPDGPTITERTRACQRRNGIRNSRGARRRRPHPKVFA